MKFINNKFFYDSNSLITRHSYWWVLMGVLSGNDSNSLITGTDSSTTNALNEFKNYKKSYTIESGSKVTLNNVFVCGIAKGTKPEIVSDADEQKGTVVLRVGGSSGESSIPFTVGSSNSGVGHTADSLWLLALQEDFDTLDSVKALFPFTIAGDIGSEIQQYSGLSNSSLDVSDTSKCIPLIGYNVSSDVVNNINYSGFTVGESIVTLSGLVSE